MIKKRIIAALTLAGFACATQASEREELETLKATTLALIDALVAKGILTEDAARDMVANAEEKGKEQAAASEAAEQGVVRVPYIPEVVKREIREQLRQEVVAQAKEERWGDVNAIPEWVSRLQWEGDLRLRYQGDLYASSNPTDQTTLTQYQLAGIPTNGEDDRHRARVRARLGLQAKVTDYVSAGLRITTGNTNDPVSTNQTLGTSYNKYSLVLDRAFLKVEPWDWLSISGGRIPNPFFSTDLVWDDDLNFEGLAASFRPWTHESLVVKPFFSAGAFPLQEVASSTINLAQDKWLYGAQAGFDWRSGAFSRWRVGLAYYHYEHVAGIADKVVDGFAPYAGTAPQFRQKGNSVFDISENNAGVLGLASDFRLVNLTAAVDLAQYDPMHIVLSADLIKNVGYKLSPDAQAVLGANYKKRDFGWNAKVTLGRTSISLPGDWQVYLGYRHLERDAVLDAYTDSDFRLGGTDAKGYYLGGAYGVDRNAWLSAKWMSADEIDGLPYGVDVLQMDFNAKF